MANKKKRIKTRMGEKEKKEEKRQRKGRKGNEMQKEKRQRRGSNNPIKWNENGKEGERHGTKRERGDKGEEERQE